jgi:transposase-like protein
MSRGKKARQFSSEYKLKAVERLLAGESASVVAREFKVVRKLLYYWKDAYISEGPEGLRKVGRPRKDRRVGVLPEVPTDRGELLQARKRIADLERKVGHQQMQIDFFVEALRRMDAIDKELADKKAERSTLSSESKCSKAD